MTKLCNTCEYLKYCARSGIEEVGCDRYKKDTTTNEEWLRQATTEQLAEFIVGQRKGCVYADCPNGETPCMSCKDGCDIDKLVVWLKQPHSK